MPLEFPTEVGDETYALQLVNKEPEVDPKPLCTLSPLLTMGSSLLDWVTQKLKDLQDCLEISCVGYGEQFKALLITKVERGPFSIA